MKRLFMSFADFLTIFRLLQASKTFLNGSFFLLGFFCLSCLPRRCFAFDLLFLVNLLFCIRINTSPLRWERLAFVLFFASAHRQIFWILCLFETDFHLFKSCRYIDMLLNKSSLIWLKRTCWLVLRKWSSLKLYAR